VDADLAKDTDNRYYWRANRRRLEAEGIWDSLLVAGGKLDVSKVGGPSAELDSKMTRRGMYGAISRVFPNEFQTMFDLPIPTLSAERRYTTNVALQRLFFLNNEFVHKQAAAMAERVKAAGNEDAQVRKAFEIVYQRDPSPEELSFSLALLHEGPTSSEPATRAEVSYKTAAFAAKPDDAKGSMTSTPEPASAKPVVVKKVETPLEALCWALLSSNEFLFLN